MSEIIGYIFPGMMIFFLFMISQNALLEILIEDENQTLHRILSTPVSIKHFLISKMIRCFILGTVVMMTGMIFTSLVFGMKLGNVFLLLIVILVSTFCITGILSIIYGLSKTKESANGFGILVIMYFGMLGGSMIQVEAMPKFMQILSIYTPNRWGIMALQNVMQSEPSGELVKPLTILVICGAVTSILGLYFFIRRYRKFGAK